MAGLDDPTIPVPRVGQDFKTANPEVFAKVAGDLDTTRRLGAIELRAEAIKERFTKHFEKHEEVWVARESLKLVAKRTFPTFQHPAPRGFEARRSGPDFAELMMSTARRNVHARAIRRLTAINTVKANLQNALIRNRPQQVQQCQPANDQRQKPTQKQGSP